MKVRELMSVVVFIFVVVSFACINYDNSTKDNASSNGEVIITSSN